MSRRHRDTQETDETVHRVTEWLDELKQANGDLKDLVAVLAQARREDKDDDD